jgi:hypothetical protein
MNNKITIDLEENEKCAYCGIPLKQVAFIYCKNNKKYCSFKCALEGKDEKIEPEKIKNEANIPTCNACKESFGNCNAERYDKNCTDFWNNVIKKQSTNEQQKQESKCLKCDLLLELYKSAKKTKRNYWVMTELFMYLHNNHDYCKPLEKIEKELKENGR